MDEKKLMERFDRLNRKMRRCFAGYFTGTPLTSIQGLTLHYIIVESEYRDVFPKDLEEFLEIKGSSVNSLINNLEKNGYVRRESISEDGRYKKLVLTEKADLIGDDIVSRVTDYMKGMFVGIPEDDLEAFQRVIEKMEENTGQ
jgi:DNA-binding MarR family transcriptional regulator